MTGLQRNLVHIFLASSLTSSVDAPSKDNSMTFPTLASEMPLNPRPLRALHTALPWGSSTTDLSIISIFTENRFIDSSCGGCANAGDITRVREVYQQSCQVPLGNNTVSLFSLFFHRHL